MEEYEKELLQAKVDLARAVIRLRETDDWILVIQKMFDEDFVNTTVSNYARFKQERRYIAEEGFMARSVLRSFLDELINDGNIAIEELKETDED